MDEYLCVARGSWNVLRIRRMTASDWRAPRTATKKEHRPPDERRVLHAAKRQQHYDYPTPPFLPDFLSPHRIAAFRHYTINGSKNDGFMVGKFVFLYQRLIQAAMSSPSHNIFFGIYLSII